MMIDIDNRGTGKTTSLIMDSYFTGVPIITTTVTRKNNILYQAQAMGITDVKVLTVNEVVNDKTAGLELQEVYVDELQEVLQYCLGLRVVKATMTRRP